MHVDAPLVHRLYPSFDDDEALVERIADVLRLEAIAAARHALESGALACAVFLEHVEPFLRVPVRVDVYRSHRVMMPREEDANENAEPCVLRARRDSGGCAGRLS